MQEYEQVSDEGDAYAREFIFRFGPDMDLRTVGTLPRAFTWLLRQERERVQHELSKQEVRHVGMFSHLRNLRVLFRRRSADSRTQRLGA